MDGRVRLGAACYPKVLAESYGSVMQDRLARRIVAAIQEEMGLDLSNPDDEVRPGDRIVGSRGLDELVPGGESEYEAEYKRLIDSLMGSLKMVKAGSSYTLLADKVEERVGEIFDWLTAVHDSVKELDPSCDARQACDRVDGLVEFVSEVKYAVERGNDKDEDKTLEEVKGRISELEAVRAVLNVVEWSDVAAEVRSLTRVRQENLELEDKLKVLEQSLSLYKTALLPLLDKIGARLDSPSYWTDRVDVKLEQAADDVSSLVRPLFERLLGSPEISEETVKAALESLGPPPEF